MNPVIKKALDAKLNQLGVDWLQVESLDICSADQTVFAVVALDGEEESVEITAIYRWDADDLLIDSVEASRPWMTSALTLVLATKDHRFTLPTGMVGMAVRMLL